jgi:transketolase
VSHTFDSTDELAVATLRTLAMDAVEAAQSGHPGTPMALAPVAWVLFTRVLKHSPGEPGWPDRDRFVLSCGHASMLLYGIFHLTGYELGLDELKHFRQWGSRTAGHPEHGLLPGVEVTTGPLGQGCATSVGMALAESHLAAELNRPEGTIVDHHTWVIVSDGDLMEGLSSEAASLAGHLGLGKLTWIWDDNRITIEGETSLAFSEDVEARFRAYGWHTQRVNDANDLAAIADALDAARAETARPSLIAVRSHIAWGAPTKQDTASAHGSPLGADEIRGAKRAYGWPEDAQFLVPAAAAARGREAVARGAEAAAAWRRTLAAWSAAHPELAAEWRRRLERRLPEGWSGHLPAPRGDGSSVATRNASGEVLKALGGVLPELIGGSADLAPSCKTTLPDSRAVTRGDHGGRVLHFGIREHAMAAMLNGLALHGGLRPFGSTFLVFSDYMRPSIRLAALMGLPVIYVFTHDSIWVGEDGPTHQPIEHLLALRAIPNLTVLRPADRNETIAAWRVALEHDHGPVALILSRQGLPSMATTAAAAAEGVARGAYVLEGAASGSPQVVVIGTGSEVALAAEAARRLAERGVAARVVSMPSWELFEAAGSEWRERVLPPGVPRVSVEAGTTLGWREWVGDGGATVGIDRFGASAPGREVAERLGLTADHVVEAALAVLGR